MNTLMRCIRKNKRGIVGIEAAIVLIAFVVIAAALAYVVINMGFYAGQKAKSTIDQGVSESTSEMLTLMKPADSFFSNSKYDFGGKGKNDPWTTCATSRKDVL